MVKAQVATGRRPRGLGGGASGGARSRSWRLSAASAAYSICGISKCSNNRSWN